MAVVLVCESLNKKYRNRVEMRMSKKQLFWIIALVSAFALSGCGKKTGSESSENQAASMENMGKQICEKVMDCAMENLKGIPEAQRKMAEGMMAQNKKACLGQYKPASTEEPSKKVVYSKEELDLAKDCLDDMVKASCKDLMNPANQPASCKKFQELAAKKG